jgi:hypothetical protein
MDRGRFETTAAWGTSIGLCKAHYSHPASIFFFFYGRAEPDFPVLKISRLPLFTSFCFDLSDLSSESVAGYVLRSDQPMS